MYKQSIEQLHTLKLTGMTAALSLQCEQPSTYADLSFEERLGMLVDREILERENRRLTRLLQAAKLRLPASIEEIDYRHPRGLEKSKMAALASCNWIARHQNLLITGPTGSGKT